MLVFWKCHVLIRTRQLLAQQTAEKVYYTEHSSTKLYGYESVLAMTHCGFPNSKHSQCRSVLVNGVNGDENDTSYVCVHKYGSTILCHVSLVVMMNLDEHFYKTINRVCIFAARYCLTYIYTATYNVEMVLFIITTPWDVSVNSNRWSFKYSVKIRRKLVLSNRLSSVTYLSIKLPFFECVNRMGLTRADVQTLISACRMKQMTCIGIRPKVVLSLFLNEHNALYQAKFENDVIKLCLSGANADKSLPVQKKISNIEVTANKHVETVVNYRHGRLNARSSFGTDKNEANVENSGTVEMPDLNDLINNLQRLYAVNILDDEAQIKEVQEGTLTCQNGKIRNIVSCSKQDDSFEEHNQTTQKQCQPLKDVGRKGNDNDKGNLKHIFKDIGSVFISAPRVCIVAPVTRNEHRGDEQKAVVLRKLYDIVERTLKHESVPAQESMMFELLRLCTFRTFPKDKKPDVNAFSAAGFYYASKNDEVICYSCYKRISNWGNSDDPSIVHRRISPECKFNTNNSEVNVSKAVTTLVESDIMAKLQGTRGLRNASHANNATFSAPKVPSNVIDGKSPSATGSSHESSVAIQMKTFQKTNHDHDAPSDSSPPTSRLSDTTAERRFQCMILQTTSTDIVSSIRSRFQTGKFVSSVNFAIPDSNTKAIQPVDNNIIPGITIDDYIKECNSGCNDDNKSISKPSTQARDKGLNGIVESLITSEASLIVQGMGYDSSLLKQALTRLVQNDKTKPRPQDIMQEIFLIEDESTSIK